jgi:hypothetical protein
LRLYVKEAPRRDRLTVYLQLVNTLDKAVCWDRRFHFQALWEITGLTSAEVAPFRQGTNERTSLTDDSVTEKTKARGRIQLADDDLIQLRPGETIDSPPIVLTDSYVKQSLEFPHGSNHQSESQLIVSPACKALLLTYCFQGHGPRAANPRLWALFPERASDTPMDQLLSNSLFIEFP